MERQRSHFAPKVLYDIEKLVVDLGLVLILVLNGVEVVDGVSDAEGAGILV